MGLKEILDEINKEAETQSHGIVNEAKVQSTQILMQKSEELEKRYERKQKALDQELSRLSKKLKAKAELDAQREIYKMESTIIESILDESFENLVDYLNDHQDKNIEFVSGLIRKTVIKLNVDSLTIRLNVENEALFDKIKKKVNAKLTLGDHSQIRGGVICIQDNIYIDNSIETIYNHLKPQFREWIMKELNKERNKDEQ